MVFTVVCDVLGKENNGTTIAAMNLIRSLRAKGHTVRVVCPDKEREGQEGFFVTPTYDLGPLNAYVEKNGVSLAKPDLALIERAIDGADAVHVMIPFALGRAAARIALEKGIPLTAGFHCQAENLSTHLFLMNAPLFSKLLYREFYDRFYRYCDAVHYPTRFICDVFESEVGPTNHYIISNGVDRRFRRPERREKSVDGCFTIVFTGRYSKEKSHMVLLRAVERSKYRDRIRLVLAGSGPLEKKLKRYAAKHLPIMPRFEFFSRTELIGVLQNADLYVHPAEIEIEAIACLEAISCGLTPVIADSPRSATNSFALGERNLFRYNDPDSLAERIDWWLDHPEEREKCSAAYENYARRFDFDRCMDRMEAMLVSTVREARLQRGLALSALPALPDEDALLEEAEARRASV